MLLTPQISPHHRSSGIDIASVFSADTYTGDGVSQSITTGVDLSSLGGTLIFKDRTAATDWFIYDSERTDLNTVLKFDPNNQATQNISLAFNSTGYSLTTALAGINKINDDIITYTLAITPKFFDIQTYTGNGTSQNIAHNLGVEPGMIWVKNLDGGAGRDWVVYHRSNTANPETDYLNLNDADATADLISMWNDTAPTSSVFTVGSHMDVNENTQSFVAYLFAHDTSSAGVIQCGSYTGNGSATGPTVTLGWDPQFIVIKNIDTSARDWHIFDTARGIPTGTGDEYLEFNTTNSAVTSVDWVDLNGTGFDITTTDAGLNTNLDTYIYVAIRAEGA